MGDGLGQVHLCRILTSVRRGWVFQRNSETLEALKKVSNLLRFASRWYSAEQEETSLNGTRDTSYRAPITNV